MFGAGKGVDFLAEMKAFDKDSMSDATFRKLKKYATDPNETLEGIERIAKVNGCIYKWVRALYEYRETRQSMHGLPAAAEEETKQRKPTT